MSFGVQVSRSPELLTRLGICRNRYLVHDRSRGLKCFEIFLLVLATNLIISGNYLSLFASIFSVPFF
jgi:hypothetical protein